MGKGPTLKMDCMPIRRKRFSNPTDFPLVEVEKNLMRLSFGGMLLGRIKLLLTSQLIKGFFHFVEL